MYYEYNDGDVDVCVDDGYISVGNLGNNKLAYLPRTKAERLKMAEAILDEPGQWKLLHVAGREVADVIYKDELPEVTERDDLTIASFDLDDPSRSWTYPNDLLLSASKYRNSALAVLAIARHVEAHNAANAEFGTDVPSVPDPTQSECSACRAEREIEDLRWELQAQTDAGTVGTKVARRAYELGARTPQGERG